jgi:hypothetical protein
LNFDFFQVYGSTSLGGAARGPQEANDLTNVRKMGKEPSLKYLANKNAL